MTAAGSPGSAAFRAGKAVRDVMAGALGSAAAAWRPAEDAFAAAGRRLHGRWHAYDALHRVVMEVLARRRAGPVFRRMRLGPVTVWGDVAHFSFGTAYYQRRGYERETVELMARVVRPGGTVVDVGANHGFFTVLLALLVGEGGRVEALEPNPVVAAALDEVLGRNGVAERVSVHPLALCDRADGTAEFFVAVSEVNDGLSSLLVSPAALEHGVISRDHSIQVRTDTFDAFAGRLGLGRVDLVKIDVEGAEAMVVRGMAGTLAVAPPRRIVCETVPDGEAMRLLLAAGYTARALDVTDTGIGNYLFTARDAG
ncbi:MAG TPA: FkbM family methyltransferase [Longimicrobium sp.]|nr:FkbM family methyltransferase [Longimicrobium sp.]